MISQYNVLCVLTSSSSVDFAGSTDMLYVWIV